MTTYTIVIVNIRPNLVLLVLVRGLFGVDLAVRRNEPVTGGNA